MTDQTPTPEPQAAPALTPDQLSGKTFRRYNLGALAVGLVALGVGAQFAFSDEKASIATVDPLGFAADARWDDGQAEVARYAATRTIYGEARSFELIRIAVKEPYDPLQRVKPDTPRRGIRDAIKTVAVHEVPCGRPYTYRQQLICRVAQADPGHLFDATISSQEWCGSTFGLLVRRDSGFERQAHSYWDGQGDWTDRLKGELWVADQFAFALRGLDPKNPPGEVSVLPSILNNKAPKTQPTPATIECRAQGVKKTVGVGTFSCAHWVVTLAGREQHYWVGEGDGRPLVAFDDGVTSGELSTIKRSAYWSERR